MSNRYIQMSKLLIIIILFSFVIKVNAQHLMGIKVYGGLTKMRLYSICSCNYYFADLTIKNKVMLKENGGIFYNYHLNNNIIIGAELVYVQMKYFRHSELSYINSSDNIWENDIIDLSYIGIPFYIGRKSNRFSINVGVLTLLLLNYKWKIKGEQYCDGIISRIDENFEIDIDKYDIGPSIGIVFKLNDRLFLESNFFMGVNNLFEKENKETQGGSLYNQQLTVGLRYAFLKHKL